MTTRMPTKTVPGPEKSCSVWWSTCRGALLADALRRERIIRKAAMAPIQPPAASRKQVGDARGQSQHAGRAFSRSRVTVPRQCE